MLTEIVLAQEFDPSQSVGVIRALLVAFVSLALIYITLSTLFGSARQGNSGKVARVLAAVVLALIPLVIALYIGAAEFGSSIIDWLIPGLGA